jgi:hypothetical protein
LKNNDTVKPGSKKILAFMWNRFIGDLEIYKETAEDLAILNMPHNLLGGLYRYFYEGEDPWKNWASQCVVDRRNCYRKFLRRFIPKVYRRIDIKLVIGSGFAYPTLLDWGAVSHELGYSYIVFHREGYMGSDIEKHDIEIVGANGRHFEGTKLVLQSKEHCELLIKCGYVNKMNSSTGGTVRMDKLIRDSYQLCDQSAWQKNGQCVTMFSFGPSTGFYARPEPPLWPREDAHLYIYDVCRLTHIAVARFALANPDIEVIIKAKWHGPWEDGVLGFLESDGISIHNVPNLHFNTTADVHSLIKRSRVVIGYGSTTLLESAICGRAVVVPKFGELVDKQFQENILFPDISDCFDQACSAEDLIEKIGYRWDNPKISDSVMNRRRAAFERYISPLDGLQAERNLELMRKYAN